MTPKTTLVLLGLAVALGSYILFVERHSLNTTAKAEQFGRLFPDLNPDQVDAIEITRTNRYRVRAERTGTEWRLTEPKLAAQQTAIDAFLQLLPTLKKLSYLTPQELTTQTNARAGFGLEPPQSSITIEQGTDRIQFAVGVKTLAGKQVYVQRIGDAGIAVTDAALLERIPETVADWRNPMLLPDPRIAFDHLRVTNGASIFAVQRDPTNQLWNLTKPIRASADSRLITYLIQELRTSRVTEFVTDDPKADLEPYGLTNPNLNLSLAAGSNVVLQLQFGKTSTNDPAQIYARIVDRNSIVLIPNTIPDLLRQPHTTFRNRTLAPINPLAVDRIEAVMHKADSKQTLALERAAPASWRIVEPFQAPADAAYVQRFLENFSNLEIIEFEKDVVTDFSAYGLEQPVRQYTLRASITNAAGPTNRVLAQIEFGADNIDRTFARRSNENAVYTVSLADVLSLPQAAFEFRDRQIWDFPASNVVSIAITQRGETRKLSRDSARLWNADLVAHEAMEEIVHRLGQLTADDWVAEGEERLPRFSIFPDAYRIALEVVEGQNTRTFAVDFSTRPTLYRYAAVTIENDRKVIFKFPTALFALVEQHLNIPVASTPH